RRRRRRDELPDDEFDDSYGRRSRPRYSSASYYARLTRTLLFVNATFIAAILVCDAIQLKYQIDLADGVKPAQHQVQIVGLVNLLLGIPYNFAYIPTAVFFLIWLHRTYSNLAALGAEHLRMSPGFAVGFWFIPLANYVMPALAVQDAWRHGDPDPERT